MSVAQIKAQYRSKFLVKVQNCLLMNICWSLQQVKKLRQEYTYTELRTGKLLLVSKLR